VDTPPAPNCLTAATDDDWSGDLLLVNDLVLKQLVSPVGAGLPTESSVARRGPSIRSRHAISRFDFAPVGRA
jgi:hypothetical protein